jgi:hypothetical protein
VVLGFEDQPYIEATLARGRRVSAARVGFLPRAPSNCHGNTAMLYVHHRGAVQIASGYALSEDGLWYQHSWGINAADGRVIEARPLLRRNLPRRR